jgi:hypothetical protein
MKRSEVIRLAQKAGCPDIIVPKEWFRFAALVAAAERERCINILKTTYIIDDGEDFVQLVLDRINNDTFVIRQSDDDAYYDNHFKK